MHIQLIPQILDHLNVLSCQALCRGENPAYKIHQLMVVFFGLEKRSP